MATDTGRRIDRATSRAHSRVARGRTSSAGEGFRRHAQSAAASSPRIVRPERSRSAAREKPMTRGRMEWDRQLRDDAPADEGEGQLRIARHEAQVALERQRHSRPRWRDH